MRNFNPERESALPKVIPERIREAREARGLSSESFGELVGVSRQAVAQYETGQLGPSAEGLSSNIAITKQPSTFFCEPQKKKVRRFVRSVLAELKTNGANRALTYNAPDRVGVIPPQI
jgi:transcriptional regulator with XRE-family HTH domain